MIEAAGLGKAYGGTVAVDDLSFVAPEGQVTGFLGPNGAGKSTTMRLMLGLDRGQGRTRFYGKSLTEVDCVSRMVGAHLDAKYFHPKRTARNHLRMLATEARVPARRVDEVIELLGLASAANRKPKGFSLGMGQRLGLAGAMLAEPKVLLLDEPANGLDPQSIRWLRDTLKWYADQGNTVFVSSHLLSEMQLMADHLVIIAKGRLLCDEPMADFVARSAQNDVYLRTEPSAVERLLVALRSRGAVAAPDGDDGIAVTGLSEEQVGWLVYQEQAPVLALLARTASLEEAFLEMTRGHEGFEQGEQP